MGGESVGGNLNDEKTRGQPFVVAIDITVSIVC